MSGVGSVLIDTLVEFGTMSGMLDPSTVRPLPLLVVPCSSSMDVSCKEALVFSVSKDRRRAEQPEAGAGKR